MINAVTIANYNWLATTQQDIWFVYEFVCLCREENNKIEGRIVSYESKHKDKKGHKSFYTKKQL